MAMQTQAIQNKMKSVANIGKITKAMEMISVSRMKRSIEKRANSVLFAQESFSLLHNLAQHPGLTHPYLEPGQGKKILLLVIASNKGLCGGYNMNVSKQVSEFVKNNPQEEVEVVAVGKQAQKIATRNNLKLVASYNDFSNYYTPGEVRSLLHFLFEKFESDEYREVHVTFTRFISSLSYQAKTRKFIPFPIEETKRIGIAAKLREDSKQDFALYTLEPNEQEVLDTVVPTVLTTVLYHYLLEGLASEHSARVSAMKSATDNAKELGEELRVSFNRARQAAITQEIAEIVGGSSAISE